MVVGTFSSVTSPGGNKNGTKPHDHLHDQLHDQPHDQLHMQDPPGRGFPVCPLRPDAIAGESSYADLSSKLSEKGSRMKMDFMTKMIVNWWYQHQQWPYFDNGAFSCMNLKVHLHQELLIFFWKFCEHNRKFLFYVLKVSKKEIWKYKKQFFFQSSDVLDLLVPILHYLNDARADQARVGLMHIGETCDHDHDFFFENILLKTSTLN